MTRNSTFFLGLLVAFAQVPAAWGGEVISGIEAGIARPIDSLDDATEAGAALGPFVGYKFNDVIGLVGQGHAIAFETTDRPGIRDDDVTWALGATAGPRLSIPLNGAEIFATGQAGYFAGPSDDSAIDESSFGYLIGGGVNLPVRRNLLMGVFGRYHRLDQQAYSGGDVKFAVGGISLTWRCAEELPPPPAPVAKAPPVEEKMEEAAIPVQKKIVLRGVNFAYDSSAISEAASPILEEVVSVLKENSEIKVVAEGHTDGRGSDAYNEKLSERRAASVVSYLVDGGVAAKRLRSVGFGESRPVASNLNDEGRAQNRRVELRIEK